MEYTTNLNHLNLIRIINSNQSNHIHIIEKHNTRVEGKKHH